MTTKPLWALGLGALLIGSLAGLAQGWVEDPRIYRPGVKSPPDSTILFLPSGPVYFSLKAWPALAAEVLTKACLGFPAVDIDRVAKGQTTCTPPTYTIRQHADGRVMIHGGGLGGDVLSRKDAMDGKLGDRITALCIGAHGFSDCAGMARNLVSRLPMRALDPPAVTQ